MPTSDLEAALQFQIKVAGLPVPEREVTLIPGRKFRVDFLWREAKLVLEADGGTYIAGRHVRGSGYEQDCVKTNELACLGYRSLHVTAAMVDDGRALQYIERGLGIVGDDKA